MNALLPRTLVAPLLASILMFSGACGPDGQDGGPGGADCAANLLPGDLVITEIMANPDGPDDGNEWFEIYNATGNAIDLTGLVLEYRSTPGDATSGSLHAVNGTDPANTISIPGQSYFVFSGVLKQFAPAYVDYGYGSDLGGLGNSDTRSLLLHCNDTVVDAVDYTDPPDGESVCLSRLVFPDAIENDEQSNWFEGETDIPEAPGNLGTPGAMNGCGEAPPCMCLDGTELRATVVPQVGDVVITEIMPNPDAVPDGDGEWFEIKAVNGFDLNGLTFGRDPAAEPDGTIALADCAPIAAGAHLLFVENPEPATNGNLPEADVDYGFSLGNTSGQLFVGNECSEVLDVVTWSNAPAGASFNLDPDFCTPEENDREESFCPSTDNSYGDGDLGTPGAANQQCPVPGECTDLTTGMPRPAVAPAIGDLEITEFMANPDVVGDSQGEWIEIRANASVDLNGLDVRKMTDGGSTGSTVIDSTDCIAVSPGDYVVVTREADPMINGCIDPSPAVANITPNPALIDFALNNSNTTLYLTHDAGDIDTVYFTSTSGGSSSSLDENSGMWCANTTDIYDTCALVNTMGMPLTSNNNTGTPGAANPACP